MPDHRNFSDTILLGNPDGYSALAQFRHGEVMVSVGCRKPKSLAVALKYWSKGHYNWECRREIASALQHLKRVAKLRGWIKPSKKVKRRVKLGGWEVRKRQEKGR